MGQLGNGLRTIDWSKTKLEHFEKNFYVEDKRVSARSDREIEEFRRLHEMRVSEPFFSGMPIIANTDDRSKAAASPALCPLSTSWASLIIS